MALDLQESAGRQWPLVAKLNFTYEDLVPEAGETLPAVIMPVGSFVLRAAVIVTEAFNSTGDDNHDTLEVGDDDDDDRYGEVDLQDTGYNALVPTGYMYEGRDAVTLTYTRDGSGQGQSPSSGAGILLVEYVMRDRATEVQPAVLQT